MTEKSVQITRLPNEEKGDGTC